MGGLRHISDAHYALKSQYKGDNNHRALTSIYTLISLAYMASLEIAHVLDIGQAEIMGLRLFGNIVEYQKHIAEYTI